MNDANPYAPPESANDADNVQRRRLHASLELYLIPFAIANAVFYGAFLVYGFLLRTTSNFPIREAMFGLFIAVLATTLAGTAYGMVLGKRRATQLPAATPSVFYVAGQVAWFLVSVVVPWPLLLLILG